MTREEIGTIGYATRAPVQMPPHVASLCVEKTRELRHRLFDPPGNVWTQSLKLLSQDLRRKAAHELYEAFPYPTILSRELGVNVHTLRDWLRQERGGK